MATLSLLHIALIYLAVINVVTFFVYGVDKWKAKKSKWRIREAALLGLAVLGGSIGAWLGMKVWHHKTLHKKFRYGIPAIIIIQLTLIVTHGSNKPIVIHRAETTEGVVRAKPSLRTLLLGGLQQVKDSTARHASIHRHCGRGTLLRMDRLNAEETARRTAGTETVAEAQRQPLDGTE